MVTSVRGSALIALLRRRLNVNEYKKSDFVMELSFPALFSKYDITLQEALR